MVSYLDITAEDLAGEDEEVSHTATPAAQPAAPTAALPVAPAAATVSPVAGAAQPACHCCRLLKADVNSFNPFSP